MSNHFKKERKGVEVDANKASGDILYQEFKRPVTGGVAAAGIARGAI